MCQVLRAWDRARPAVRIVPATLVAVVIIVMRMKRRDTAYENLEYSKVTQIAFLSKIGRTFSLCGVLRSRVKRLSKQEGQVGNEKRGQSLG